jgi:hypothetical protein
VTSWPSRGAHSRHRTRAAQPFARTELTRLALAILREANEPLPIRTVAVRAPKAKGVTWPDPALRRRTRTKLREAFGKLHVRSLTAERPQRIDIIGEVLFVVGSHFGADSQVHRNARGPWLASAAAASTDRFFAAAATRKGRDALRLGACSARP